LSGPPAIGYWTDVDGGPASMLSIAVHTPPGRGCAFCSTA
jgi:hypothetical protein